MADRKSMIQAVAMMLLGAAELAHELSTRAIARAGAPGVEDGSLAIGFERVRRGYHVHVERTLRAYEAAQGRALILHLATTRCPPLSIECDRATLMNRVGPGGRPSPPSAALDLRDGESTWDGATIRLVLDWPVREMSEPRVPTFFVAPEFIPRIVSGPPTVGWPIAPQPLIELTAGAHDDELHRYGVPAQLADRDRWLQVGLQYSAQRLASLGSEPSLLLAGEFMSSVGRAEQHSIVEYIGEVFAFLEDRLSSIVGAELLLGDQSGLLGAEHEPLGAQTMLPVSFFTRYASEPDYRADPYSIAAHVAALWWRSLCRLRGEGDRELTVALCGAMGLAWTRHTGDERRVAIRRANLLRDGSRSAFHDRLAAARGKLREGLIARVMLALDDRAVESGDSVYRRLGEFVWHHRGQLVPTERVVELLSELEIRLNAGC